MAFIIKTSLALAIISLAVFSLAAHDAHAEIYMKAYPIKGPATAPGFQNDIPLTSMQFGLAKPVVTTSTGEETGRPNFSDLSIAKQMDISSPLLLQNTLFGRSFPTVEIFLTTTSTGKIFTYNHITLTNVIISHYAVSGAGDNPAEELGLNYEKISTQYTQQNPDGSAGQTLSSCWDLVTQQDCTAATPDTIPPTTTDTLSGTAGANGWYVSPVNVTLSASDNSGGSGVAATTYSLDGGPQVPYSAPFTISGDSNHTLSFNSTDNAGNVEAAHTIYVPVDTTPPVIAVPANVTKEATGPLTIISLGTANATDAVDGQVTVTNNATASYPVGTTVIQYEASDLAGNTAYAYQSVTITDTTPPALSLPVQLLAQATGPSGAVVSYSANATDLVDGPVTPVCSPPSGSMFAFGTDTVTCTATDKHNNTATGTFDIMIINKIPPTISITSPADNVIVKTPSVKVSGNATDIVAVSSISWKVDSGTVSIVSGITPAPSVAWSFATGALTLGQHTIEVNATDSAGLVTVSTISITYAAPTVTIPPPSGSGQIAFTSGAGGFTGLGLVPPSALSAPPLPGANPLGFFSWSVTGFLPATSDTISITSPVPLSPHSQYFKLVGGTWVAVPSTVQGNTISFTISDNGPFDTNPAQGIISDPGTIASPTSGRVTGGGNIGKGTNFGFEVTSDLSKPNPIRGTLEYQDRYVKLNLHGNSISFLAIDPTTSNATIVGATTYDRHDDRDRHHIHDIHGTNYGFVATISDPDKSGQHDRFAITVTNSTGYVVYQNSGTVKGHIEIHKFADRDDRSDSGIAPPTGPDRHGH